jgi:formylglycine-generating enzyme required for sulfatase activity
LINALPSIQTKDLPGVLSAFEPWRHWANPRLRTLLHQSSEDSKEHLHASLALLPVDPTQVGYLSECLVAAQPGLTLSPSEVLVLRDALMPHQSALTPKLWSVLDSAKPGDAGLLPTAAALALYDPASARWDDRDGKVAEALVTANSLVLGSWLEALRPVRGKLTTPLAQTFRDTQRPEDIRSKATDILAEYTQDGPGLLAQLLMDADPKSFVRLFPMAERQADRTVPVFQAVLAQRGTTEHTADSEQLKDRRAERQARAAVALIRLGHAAEVWPLLRHSADPRLRSFLVNWLNPLGADPQAVAAELVRLESSPLPAQRGEGARRAGEGSARGTGLWPVAGLGHGLEARATFPLPAQRGEGARRAGEGSAAPATAMDAILFHPETSARRALILALGTYGTSGLSPGEREPLIGRLLELYRHDPDAGIHGAAEWTLRQWEQSEKLETIDAELSQLKDRSGRRWTVNGQGQTFVLVEGPVEFRMGSPPTDPDRLAEDETPHRRVIPRRFAIAAKEVTVAQYQRFVREIHQFGITRSFLEKYSPEPNGPRISVTWFGAAAYCNWLSQQEGLPKDQWCYLPNAQGKFDKGMTIPADALQRSGYRLPTEAEWEYACRAGTATSRPYGLSINLLETYARYQANSKDHAWRCGSLLPNDLGLFDMLGNVIEWCQERHANYQPGKAESSIDDIVDDHPRLLRGGSFLYRPAVVRSAYRDRYAPSAWSTYSGFRLARTDN